MAGRTSHQVMSPAEAKARLRDLSQPHDHTPDAPSLLSNPALQAGAILAGALVIGAALGSRSKSGMMCSLRRACTRAGSVIAPIVVRRLAEDLTGSRRSA